MGSIPDIKISTDDAVNSIQFSDIFDLTDIQRLQDLFSDATGVASIITHPDGTPITKPSNFCRLCGLIRKTEKGRTNCFKSDAAIGKQNSSDSIVQPCLSGGLWDSGASITVGGKHIANWLIGQVRNEDVDEQGMIQYADEIGINRDDFMEALYEVPVMSVEQFNKVSKMLFAFANELSEKAYTNWQLKMQIVERKKAELLLEEKNEEIEAQNEEYQKLNEELQKKNTFIQTILDNLPIGLALNDTDRGQATYMNKKFEEIYGWASKEITSIASFFEKIYPDDEYRKQIVERIMTDINSGVPEKMYWENIFITRKDGSKRVVNAANIPLTEQNTMVSTVMDITMLHQIQNDLVKAKERAEESDKLKTAFLNNISHEIRTPFNGILGFLSLLQEDDLAANERDEYISIINKSAYRLMNTISDIVEISQIQVGQTKLSVSETNIRKLISGVYNHFKPDAESKGLTFNFNNDLPVNLESIYVDNIKLNAILSILIGNAIKFTKSGSIVFGIRLVDQVIGTSSSHTLLQFSVKDTGIGISENKKQEIFERFIQADGSNTRQYEGSGLGLSIAKAYVEMLGGNIEVESEEGRGSVFYLTLPLDITPKDKGVNRNTDPTKGTENLIRDLKVLIAEDDEESAVLLQRTIKAFGKEVIKVRNSVDAIEACRKNPDIDLVLMDIKMSGIDGYEATRQIRQFNTDVVIIAQTAYALTGDWEKAIEAGCNDYISKPINKDQFMALMKKYFNVPGNIS
jgi:PAS domain S-box-containing protein